MYDEEKVQKLHLSIDDHCDSSSSFQSKTHESKKDLIDKYIDNKKIADSSPMLRKTNNIMGNFLAFYTSSNEVSSKTKCIIMRNNVYKLAWDMFVLVILLIVSMVVPVRLAFSSNEPFVWFLIFMIADCIFAIDLVLTFFTSIPDEHKVYE